MQRILSMLVAVGITALLFAAAVLGAAWFMNHAATWAFVRAPWFRHAAVIFNVIYIPLIGIWVAVRKKSAPSGDSPTRLPRIAG